MTPEHEKSTAAVDGKPRLTPYEWIKQAIMSGTLVPGQPLVEISLAEQCQVSRTPVREALTRLEQDGLVQRTAQGLVVRESSPGEIIDLYETRVVLESKAAQVAASRHTRADMSAIKRTAENYRRVDPDDVDRMVDLNREFHRSVWYASHNLSLIDLLERLNMQLGRRPSTTLRYSGRRETTLIEHDQIITAIAEGDAEAAAIAASLHFNAALDIQLKLLEES